MSDAPVLVPVQPPAQSIGVLRCAYFPWKTRLLLASASEGANARHGRLDRRERPTPIVKTQTGFAFVHHRRTVDRARRGIEARASTTRERRARRRSTTLFATVATRASDASKAPRESAERVRKFAHFCANRLVRREIGGLRATRFQVAVRSAFGLPEHRPTRQESSVANSIKKFVREKNTENSDVFCKRILSAQRIARTRRPRGRVGEAAAASSAAPAGRKKNRRGC